MHLIKCISGDIREQTYFLVLCAKFSLVHCVFADVHDDQRNHFDLLKYFKLDLKLLQLQLNLQPITKTNYIHLQLIKVILYNTQLSI